LVGPLNRNVLDVQPSLFGIGLYQLSGPTAVNALVQHGPFNMNNQRSVRFIRIDDANNHRAAFGYRKGWLMFLGIPLDYRNSFDIANAVSTFGKFHHWNSADPILERTLVFASFPSPALVPRDVVYGKYASVGGTRESWTAPLFILSADFADMFPPDEDQMPLDGNPHPMPGNLQPNQHLFVPPQFPEIGWDMPPLQDDHINGQHEQDQLEPMDQMDAAPEQESMVLNPSDGSGSSVNGMDEGLDLVQHVPGLLQQNNQLFQVMHVGRMMFGPQLPPAMQWAKMLEFVLPSLYFKNIAPSLHLSPFSFAKCSGDVAVDFSVSSIVQHGDSGSRVSQIIDVDFPSEDFAVPSVAVSTSMVKQRKKRTSKLVAPVVVSEERRFTRSCLKDGFRPKPVLGVQPKPKKKQRSKMLLVVSPLMDNEAGVETEEEPLIPPPTPIPVMQRVGVQLGVDPSKITAEKLGADLAENNSTGENE
jgi:hypothetical protein